MRLFDCRYKQHSRDLLSRRSLPMDRALLSEIRTVTNSFNNIFATRRAQGLGGHASPQQIDDLGTKGR